MATENAGRFRHSLVDFDGQPRQFSFDSPIITAANHDAMKSDHDALVAAIADVTLGELDFEEFVADREQVRPRVKPSVAAAQAHITWIVTYIDDVTDAVSHVQIPTADLSDTTLFMPNSVMWDPSDAKWVTFIAAFEGYVLSPAGNAVSLQSVELSQ